MTTIRASGLYKIFGNHPERAMELLEQGASQGEVQQQTGQVVAVADANFEVAEGEIFVLMGLSGSGKSTLLRMLNRLYEPTTGTVEIGGRDITGLGPKELRRLRATQISMVFQHFALFPHRSVLDNAAWGLEVQRMDKDKRHERAAEALRLVGLAGWEHSTPAQLSGGMKQRVGLARALATDADVLLMDEAFSALDPLIRRDMQDQLLELQQGLDKTIVFVTHDLNEAMRLGDRVAVMREGRIVQIGSAEAILNDPANDYVAAFLQDVDRSRVFTASQVMEETKATVFENEGPRAAIRNMRALQASALYVISRGRTCRGIVVDDDVAEAARRGEEHLDGLIRQDFHRTSPDTVIAELLGPAAASPVPIAVVDDSDRLLGVVPRVTLLTALGGAPQPDDEETSPSDLVTGEGGTSLVASDSEAGR